MSSNAVVSFVVWFLFDLLFNWAPKGLDQGHQVDISADFIRSQGAAQSRGGVARR
jgi:hypothetical protein